MRQQSRHGSPALGQKSSPAAAAAAARLRRAQLAEERRLREEAESRLARALENNGALARSNLRLQEQLARLRGEADVQQHGAGCLRAAAAAREAEAATRLARLQAALARAAAEREALLRQLAGKQEVVAYLEGRLAAAATGPAERPANVTDAAAGGQAASRCESDSVVLTACIGAGPAAHRSAEADSQAAAEDSLASVDSVVGGATAEGQQAVAVAQRREVKWTLSLGVGEASSGSPAAAAPQLECAASSGACPSEEEEEEQPFVSCGASPAPVQGPPAAEVEATPMQAPPRAPSDPATTVLRSSLRARNGVSYAEPSLRAKLRQGDAHTFAFGADPVAAGGGATGGRARGRARTKPRPRFSGHGAAALQEDR